MQELEGSWDCPYASEQLKSVTKSRLLHSIVGTEDMTRMSATFTGAENELVPQIVVDGESTTT